MALGDLWNRTLVYFGIAEEDDDWDDEDGYAAEESLEQSYRERPNVRRLTPRRRGQDFDDWTESESDRPTSRALAGRASRRACARCAPQIEAVPNPTRVRVHLVLPRSFNDAQQIADKFKQGIPVILNLQSADTELSKRLIDFASGLTYALNGGMQRVADKVFLLTPRNVEVSRRAARGAARARRVLQPGVGEPRCAARRRRPMVCSTQSPQVELFVDVFVGVYTLAIFVVRPDVVGPAAVLAAAGAALPLRRLRAVPAPLAADPADSAGPIDFSPMVAVIALIAFDRIVVAMLDRLH